MSLMEARSRIMIEDVRDYVVGPNMLRAKYGIKNRRTLKKFSTRRSIERLRAGHDLITSFVWAHKGTSEHHSNSQYERKGALSHRSHSTLITVAPECTIIGCSGSDDDEDADTSYFTRRSVERIRLQVGARCVSD
jgi:hypothetical protein